MQLAWKLCGGRIQYAACHWHQVCMASFHLAMHTLIGVSPPPGGLPQLTTVIPSVGSRSLALHTLCVHDDVLWHQLTRGK